jgi:hypothetical protein
VNTETYVRKVLDDWSAEAQVPAGLADRALRRHGRRHVRRTLVLVTAVALALLVAGVSVEVRTKPHPMAPPRPVDTSLHTDPGYAPPRRFVAAGQVALSAYYVYSSNRHDPMNELRTWYLYNATTGGYQKVPWGQVDVAPGLRQAAVLDGPLPTTRLGLVDMGTHQVTRWIGLPAAAAGLAWSPDGRRLLVTTYSADPDHRPMKNHRLRTGFIVVDARSGEARFHSLPVTTTDPYMSPREDFGWSRDGKLIYDPTLPYRIKVFYDLNGARRPTPLFEDQTNRPPGQSPNGRYNVSTEPVSGEGYVVIDNTTGRHIAALPVWQVLRWADDLHLIVLECQGKETCVGQSRSEGGLRLYSHADGSSVRLAGSAVGWIPVFTHR